MKCALTGCNATADKRCTRCKKVGYCSIEHQKKDWKDGGHKKVCFPPGATCTRCLKVIPYPPGQCLVPHAPHNCESSTTMFMGGNITKMKECKACGLNYFRSGPADTREENYTHAGGAQFCYSGLHTVKPLKDTDLRRVYDEKKCVMLSADDGNLQSAIEALDNNSDITILRIDSGEVAKKVPPLTIEVRLPNLKSLYTNNVEIKRLVLNEELTPNLKKLWMEDPLGESGRRDADFTILCPLLEEAGLFHICLGNDDWLNKMFEVAKGFKKLCSKKLRAQELKIESPSLEVVNLAKADYLKRLEISGTHLTDLNIRGNVALREMSFLDTQNDPDFTKELKVEAHNSNLPSCVVETIFAHPRFRGSRDSLKIVSEDDLDRTIMG